MDRYCTVIGRAGLATLIAALAPADLALAQGVTELEGIVIEGASLSGEPADAATLGSASTVITGEELERRQIRHAADALRTVPGLAVTRSGGVGSQTQVRVRGAEANQVKVIIDGVEVNSLSAGDFQFETLLAENIERIEVIRGPQSGIYGANALAGIINIVTKKGTQTPKVSAQIEGGSLGTYGVSATASGAGEHGYLSITAARRETDGFNIARSGSEEDGSQQKTIFARAGISPTDYFRVDVMGRYQENLAETDPDSPFDGLPDDISGETDLREQILGRISAELDTFENTWTHKFFADYFEDDFVSNGATFGLFENFGERRRFGYLSTLRLTSDVIVPASHVFVGLYEKLDESFESNFGAVRAARGNTGFAGEYQGAFAEQVYIAANIRHDDKDSFEDATTYRLAGAYRIPGTGTRVHASYGKGITDPTFFEQFGFTLDFQGNPDLKPEESVGWDAGIEQKFLDGRVTADLTYFEAELTDEIVGFGQTVINQIGESERRGIELALSAHLTPELVLNGTYTYTDATDPDGSEEVRRPPHSASLSLAYSFLDGRARLNADAVYNGERKDDNFGTFPATTVTLDDYVLINIAGSYKLDENLDVFGRVENLLDEDYEEVFGFSSPPITAYGGVRITLGDVPAPLEPAVK